MATSQKISELTTAGPLTGAELVPVVQNSGTLQTTVSAIKVFSLGSVENEVSLLNNRVDAVSTLATQNADAVASVQTDLGDLTVRVAAVSASVSSLNVRMAAAEASISSINSALAAINVSALGVLEPRVSALEIRMGLVSAAVSVNTAAITSLNAVVANVSARTSVNALAITSVNNVVSAQGVRLNAVSVAAVSLAFDVSILDTRVSAVSATGVTLAAAITSVNNVVSALEVRVSAVSAVGTANSAAITSINAVTSNLAVAISAVGDVSAIAALVSSVAALDAEVSTLEIRLALVSAATSVNTSAITSINAVTSSLNGRVSALEATLSIIGDVSAVAALTSTVAVLDAEVSALDIRVAAVSVSVTQRVLKAGDTMTGPLIVDVNSASDALRITQTGTGNALVVEDETSPDATPFVVNTAGNVGVGTSSPGAALDVFGTSFVRNTRFGSSSAYVQRRANGTAAAPTAVVNNDNQVIRFDFFDGANYLPGALIGAIVDGTPGINDMPVAMSFQTTPDGTTSLTERMRITNAGNVGIGTTSPSVRLDVNGSINGTWAGATVSVDRGGTGATSLTANNVILGNGTAAVQFVAPGTSGNVLTSNGTTWVSQAGGGAAGVASFSAGTTGLTPATATTGAVTLAGTLAVANGGTGATDAGTARTNLGLGTAATMVGPTGTIVGTTDTQTLSGKTINSAILNDGYTEEVFAISDGASVNLDPNNGSIQTWTLGASRTPGQANWNAGQSITLMVDDGSAFTITWSTLAVVWVTDGGTAPTLNTSGFTTLALWKVGTTIYGARVGDA